jgi:hypothetical protein
MDNGAESPGSGKHRVDDGSAMWLPMGGQLDSTTHARPLVGPGQVPAQRGRLAPDPLVDTDALGLRKFNIGLVPASVTPPRTWKRAAWFAVLSSAGVLVGLAIAAAKLVGSGPVERIGMPEYPANVPIVTAFPTKGPRPSDSVEGSATKSHGTATATGSAAPQPGERTSGGAGDGTATTRPGSGTNTAPPLVTTVPNPQPPVVDPSAIASRTEKFYEQMASNTNTAMAMTTDAFRSNAQAVLEQRFADVSLIQVKEITIDPAKGVTISTLQITRKDGTASTERRELTFTLVGEPLINAERLTGVG